MDGLNRGKKYGVVFTILLRSITILLKIPFFYMFKLVYSSRNIFLCLWITILPGGGGQDQSIVNTRHFTRLSSHHLICMIKYDNVNILVRQDRGYWPPLHIQYLSHCSGSGKMPEFSGQRKSEDTDVRQEVTRISSISGLIISHCSPHV